MPPRLFGEEELLLKVIRLFNRGTTEACKAFMFVAAVVMILACFLQVCFRKAGAPLSWSEELARYLAVWLTFIGAAYALRTKGLSTVEILYNKLEGAAQKGLYGVISIAIFIFCYMLIRYGMEFALKFMTQTSPAMQIPKGIVYLSAPISGVLMLLYQLEFVVEVFAGKEEKA